MHYYKYITLFLAALLVPACGQGETPRRIELVREVPREGDRPDPAMSMADRFGMRVAAAAPSPAGEPCCEGDGPFHYRAPGGWSAVAPTPVRNPNFIIGGDPEAQVFVTLLGSDGGGVELNLNRWRAEMGLAPLDPEGFAELERIPLMGAEAPLLDISGSFSTGAMMGGAAGRPRPGWRLIGTGAVLDGRAVFVKMTGPAGALEGQLEPFRDFCASLHPAPGH